MRWQFPPATLLQPQNPDSLLWEVIALTIVFGAALKTVVVTPHAILDPPDLIAVVDQRPTPFQSMPCNVGINGVHLLLPYNCGKTSNTCTCCGVC